MREMVQRHVANISFVAFFAILVLAVFFGLASAILPWWVLFAILTIPIMVIVAMIRPHFAAVFLVVFASGIIPERLTPNLPLLGGSIRAADLLLALLVCFWILKEAFGVRAVKYSDKIVYPFYFLGGLVVISMLVAILGFQNPPKYIAYEFRVVLYWLYAFVLSQSIRNRRDLDQCIWLLNLLAIVLSCAVLVQSFTGIQVLAFARVESLDNAGVVDSSVTRSTFGGFQNFVVLSMLIVISRYSIRNLSFRSAVPMLLLFGAGLIVTFGRAVWAATAIAVFALSYMLGWRAVFKIFVIGSVASVCAVIVLFFVKPHLLDAVAARVMSVQRETTGGESLEWRRSENQYAIKKISQYPVFGIGLGGEYQPIRNRFMSPEQTRMIHSSYYYLVLKFGFFGIFIPIWIVWVIWKRIRSLSRSSDARGSALMYSLGASLFLPILTGFVQPEWMDHKGVLFIATVCGLVFAMARLNGDSRKNINAVDTDSGVIH